MLCGSLLSQSSRSFFSDREYPQLKLKISFLSYYKNFNNLSLNQIYVNIGCVDCDEERADSGSKKREASSENCFEFTPNTIFCILVEYLKQ
jgi:hypothetical protein